MNMWMAAIGLHQLLKMSAGAAITLSQHRTALSDTKPNAVTASRVVHDILLDLELISCAEEELSFEDNMRKHLKLLEKFHRFDPAQRHCRDKKERNIAAEGVLPHAQPKRSFDERLQGG